MRVAGPARSSTDAVLDEGPLLLDAAPLLAHGALVRPEVVADAVGVALARRLLVARAVVPDSCRSTRVEASFLIIGCRSAGGLRVCMAAL